MIRNPVKRTAIALTVLFLLDLGYAGQGLYAILVAVVGVLVLTVGAMWAAGRDQKMLARSRGMRAALYLVLGVATFAVTRVYLATAETHASQIIAACQEYGVRHGALPNRLQDLVPEFFPSVPRAKYTLAYGEFTYFVSSDKSHTPMYVVFAPFGRRLYHFEQAQWTTLD